MATQLTRKANFVFHASLVFPPDTDTLGFAEEIKMRLELSGIITGSSGGRKLMMLLKIP